MAWYGFWSLTENIIQIDFLIISKKA
jgi:hypothetical protein